MRSILVAMKDQFFPSPDRSTRLYVTYLTASFQQVSNTSQL